uniref:Uncharacterized protein n=1 Tax=Ananas comosus var. bracteatus TaxID=296719 RepID=A0A6V7QYP8_ANACO
MAKPFVDAPTRRSSDDPSICSSSSSSASAAAALRRRTRPPPPPPGTLSASLAEERLHERSVLSDSARCPRHPSSTPVAGASAAPPPPSPSPPPSSSRSTTGAPPASSSAPALAPPPPPPSPLQGKWRRRPRRRAEGFDGEEGIEVAGAEPSSSDRGPIRSEAIEGDRTGAGR